MEKFKVDIEPKIKKLKQEMEEAVKDITPELLSEVNKFFEHKSNEAGIYVLESLVGLMRKTKKSDNFSVELYLKKYESFMHALHKVVPKNLVKDDCMDVVKQLEIKYDHMFLDERNKLFKPFRHVLAKLCWLGVFGDDEKKLEESLDKIDEEMSKNQRSIDMKEMFLKSTEIFDGFKEDCQFYQDVL